MILLLLFYPVQPRQTCRGDLMAIRTAGAYGRTMANRYNMRDLAPAVYSDEI